MTTETQATRRARNRDVFTDSLYLLHSKLNSENPYLVSEARRALASLRRSLSGTHQASHAYRLVFDALPAEGEQEAWLLVGGLFGIHPQPRQARGRDSSRTLGIAMRDLKGDGENTIDRRFEQLLGVDRRNLPHYLRHMVQLLRSKKIALDYGLLLDDVIVLLGERTEEATKRRVRLAWARDYHRPRLQPADPEPDGDVDPAGEPADSPADSAGSTIDTEN
ncbi:CRISPR system Cascade subunit CasB [Actinoalloteichus hoggarensis]|uniref:CRISPR-associated protein Cse2 (CRISPR_cse2) n=1 Tax=Actinoalloteichus hoggarensis TaxID=1470176 RepID=A0A221W7X2_9PSEU|nr:type I-E CRISPR-associated protein Cse2/CasB [Actinoalloteichus hoggarensis]ASO21803.1 CRISPR-associated protein Cse2 (CRISPR_cse2) [Actinoalloteichus hoggarensis]MBB5922400.1 CRISPR system Cascade subunit CasB [Actinoalloteichus hoggarensis]